jgi:hypothetical protein
MLDIQVKIDKGIARLGKMPDSVRAALKVETNALATELRDKARANAGSFFQVRTGKFLKSIKKSVRTSQKSVIGKVYSKDKVAHLLERGVKPHDIRPKNAKALAFLGVYAEMIHHPGFRGHTIINAAYQDMKSEINEGLAKAVRDGVAADVGA